MNADIEFSTVVDANGFYNYIDGLVQEHRLSYLDAIVYYCEKNNMEIEVAASLIRSNYRIKSHLQNEGQDLNFLKKVARLPI